MRVIAGSARGCRLKATAGLGTRPTTDRIKETVFNILAPHLFEADVLDLFSGTGAMGIEALSRGARQAVLVEWDRPCAVIIEQNLKAARLEAQAQLMRLDVMTALPTLQKEGRRFDLIFLDPPYGQGLVSLTLQGIIRHDLLGDAGFVMVEQGSSEEIETPESLEVFRVKQYKTAQLIFYRKGIVKSNFH